MLQAEGTSNSDDVGLICAGRSSPAVAGRRLLRLPCSHQGLQHFSSPAERREGCRGAFVT